MIYCFDKNLPFDYSREEMNICKNNGNAILYDEEESIFTDFEGNKIDINGFTIFPRTGVMQIKKMTEDILSQGGVPALSLEETEKLEQWPKYYETERKMKVLTGKDLLNQEVVKSLEREFSNKIFIKTVKKGFSAVIPISLLKDNECVFYKALTHHQADEFIVSEPIELTKDKYGKKEYRCFVVENEPFNISRFTTEVFHEIDEDVLMHLHGVIEKGKQTLPSTYVVDLLEYEKDGEKHIDVSEFNPPQASGLYLYNSLLEASNDILHKKNIKNIAREFKKEISKCSMEGEMINNRDSLYNLPGSFASDLRSIFLIGVPGITFAADIPFTEECFNSHGVGIKFEKVSNDLDKPLLSDRDLCDGPKQYTKKNKGENNE